MVSQEGDGTSNGPAVSGGSDGPTGSGQGLGLGTLLGVVTPTTLTILGVILYLRVGWVVGNAGLGGTIMIVLMAHLVTIITALSLSALATSMRVGGGGAYWLISRSMGLELGGALGIPLYLSQALSLTLYAFGLAESVQLLWPGANVPLIAAIIVVVVVLIAARSTVMALKMQLPIMAFIAVSLVSLFLGADFGGSKVPLMGEFEDATFMEVFAVFFPAVTGILAGLGLSGDLKEPSRSIPRGVMVSVIIGLVVYLAVPVVLANSADAETLRTNPMIWTEITWAPLVMGGLWGAILSSAIGSILAAPRTLQALAEDSLVPSVFAKVDKKNGEPMVALWLSGGVALTAVLLGDLNAVAGVVTMFFLTTYGMLNLAAGLEALVADPAFRPRIKVPWWASMAGCMGCFMAMFAISPIACLIAMILEGMIWWILSRRALRTTWGDLRSGMWFTLARFAMLKLGQSKHDPRNWRPHILVFVADLERNIGMVQMATNFSQDRGIVTVSSLLLGDIEEHEHAESLAERNRKILQDNQIVAFAETAAVPELESGMVTVAQANGMAGLESNMVMLGWPGEDSARLGRLLGIVRRMSGMEKSTMIIRPIKGSRARGNGQIVVWWKGKQNNGDMMLLLAHLLNLTPNWRDCRLILKSVVDSQEQADELHATFESMLPDLRMDVELDVILRPEDKTHQDVIREASVNANLVFVGMAVPTAQDEASYAANLMELLDGMPTTILVRNASRFQGRLI
jgi:potassium/chloride transporter 4/5/6